MFRIVTQIESLSGLFTLTTLNKSQHWTGAIHLENQSDYEKIIQYEDDLNNIFLHDNKFIIIKCFSKMLLILENHNGDIALCEQEWIDNRSITSINLNIGNEINIESAIIDETFIVYDSTLNHNEIQIPVEDGVYNSGFGTAYDIYFKQINSNRFKFYLCDYESVGQISVKGILCKKLT